jgi:polyisoprenoid-binding protein YceI
MSQNVIPLPGADLVGADLATGAPGADLANGAWRLDPARSSVEFQVRHLYGLITVKGQFDRYEGALDLSTRPAVKLVIEADSVDTKQGKRDAHLRSADFFDVANHPLVRFEADAATLEGETLKAHGILHVAGRQIPLAVDATVTPDGDELEIEASALADHRELVMVKNPLGIMRTPSRLIVRGRLVRATAG